MKVLVTGGSGMVGKHLQKINNNYIYLSSKDCDLTNYTDSYKVIKNINPTHIVHLAAKVGGLYMNMNNNFDMLYDNLLINMNIIKICKDLKIKNFIGCLSTCIFPDKVNYPITEEQLHKGEPHNSNFGYAHSKRILEVFCKEMNQNPENNYVCIIPTNIFGEYDNFNLKDSHVIPGLIHKCYLAKKNNKPFVIRGTGKALRQFIYAGDLAKIINHLLYNKTENKNIICSPSEMEEISIKEIVEIIMDKFDYHNVKYDTSFSDGQYKKSVSNKVLCDTIPNFVFSDFENCIENTINWFEKNYNILRK